MSGWWYFLAICHSYVTLMAVAVGFKTTSNFIRMTIISLRGGMGVSCLMKKLIITLYGLLKEFAPSVLTGLVLYAPLTGSITEEIIRYIAAIDIILTW